MLPNEWKVVHLDKAAKIIDCKHRTPKYVEDGVPLVSPGTIKWGPLDLVSPTKMVEQSDYESLMDHCTVEAGDLVLSRNQSVGIASYVESDKPFVLGQDTVLLKPITATSKFLFFMLQSNKIQKIIFKLAGGSTFSRINLSDIKKIKIDTPPLPEQTKIADILLTWDKSISITEQLLANSQQQKKALMQNLLTGKMRLKGFRGKWKKVLLGDITLITTGSSNRQDSNLDGIYTFFDRSEDIRSSDRYLFDCEAVIIPGEGQGFIPKYFTGKFDLHQRTYAVMEFKNCYGKFIYYAMSHFSNHLLSHAVGSTVKSLRLPMFQKMVMNIPRIEEQQKIAFILSSADQEIEKLQQQLAFLKQEKNALMQQLLTGKRRVKV